MGSKRKFVNGGDGGEDDVSDESGEEEAQPDLEAAVKELCRNRKDGLHREMSEAKKEELISKLEDSRQEECRGKQMAERIAWREKVRKELQRSAEFKDIMDSVHLEEVEVEEKPKMSRMSMEWREAFKNDQAGFLFPQVLSTLLKLTLTDPPDPKILVYRLVSKSAKESVDDLLSSEQFFQQVWIDECGYYIPGFSFCILAISRFSEWNLERARQFTRHFSNPHWYSGNPFFTRSIDVCISSMESSSFLGFRNEIEVILLRWGKGLTSATLDFPKDMSVEFIYDLLVSWLRLMPNLRILVFCMDYRIIEDNYGNLREHIAENPLPELPHLTNLSIGTTTNPSPIVHGLLSKFNSRLERLLLDIGRDDDDPTKVFQNVSNCPPPAILEGSFPALRRMDAWYYNIATVADVRNIIQNFNNWRLPLKRLDLRFHRRDPWKFIELDKALTSKGLFLEMPQLEELNLNVHCRMTLKTLDFLLPCKALKVLAFRFLKEVRPEKALQTTRQRPPETGIFQLALDKVDKDSLYRSRIWKLFPELKRIEFHSTSIKDTGEVHDGIYDVTIEERESFMFTREEYLQRVGLEMGNSSSESETSP